MAMRLIEKVVQSRSILFSGTQKVSMNMRDINKTIKNFTVRSFSLFYTSQTLTIFYKKKISIVSFLFHSISLKVRRNKTNKRKLCLNAFLTFTYLFARYHNNDR